jgi:3-isopropylmalate/(R)-2-methylmalate dehydratase small subunit
VSATAVRQVRSRTVVLAVDNVDTDQIIPARFLVTTSREGLGARLFNDWRYDAQGQPRPEFVLNRPEAQGARVLVGGRNFGCGSSREHAVWALQDHGFAAVISDSFADIFRGNALKNGLVPVQVAHDIHRRLLAEPGGEVVVDVAGSHLTLADGTKCAFPLEPFARYCLVNGVDELQFLLQKGGAIEAYEKSSGPEPWRLSS